MCGLCFTSKNGFENDPPFFDLCMFFFFVFFSLVFYEQVILSAVFKIALCVLSDFTVIFLCHNFNVVCSAIMTLTLCPSQTCCDKR